MKYQSGYFL